MVANSNTRLFGEVTDATGEHRLLLKFIEDAVSKTRGDEKAFNFHSLVWEIRDGSTWTPKITITQADFQIGAEHRRWIGKIHSLTPDIGHAAILVGELGPADDAGVVHATYSWREWDLIGNKQVRMIKVYDSPFDEMDTPE